MGTRLQAPKKATGAAMNRGNSRQDYATDPDFIASVRRRFGGLDVDLACNAENRIANVGHWFQWPDQDALEQDWNQLHGNLWLNPPFANIRPWAAKCEAARFRSAWTLLLVPGSIGSLWYNEHVRLKSHVLSIGRMKFVGCDDPYPKDLILACFGFGIGTDGIQPWLRWRKR